MSEEPYKKLKPYVYYRPHDMSLYSDVEKELNRYAKMGYRVVQVTDDGNFLLEHVAAFEAEQRFPKDDKELWNQAVSNLGTD